MWDESAINTHCIASEKLYRIKDRAFDEIRRRLSRGVTTTEYDVQQQMADWFGEEGLVSDSPPNVSVASNAGNPHYLPTSTASRTIRPDELVLLDLWGKLDRPGAVYADITWMGFTGRRPPEPQAKAFDAVCAARDAATALVQRAVRAGQELRGWQVDRAAASVLRSAGYGNHILHRTGHSLGENVHGNGVNMDDYETHDDRRLLAGTGFTIEPGVYFEDFGVRSEINLVVQARDAVVTGPVQTEIVALGLGGLMSTRKTTVFYVLLSAVASFAVALVLASRFEMTPSSSAQTINVPSMNSSPISGPIDALTFRNIAKAQSPMVVNIRTEMRTRTQDLSDFFGGGGGAPDDFFRRFFGPGGGGGPGGPGGQDDQDQAPNNRGRRPREQKTQAAGTGFVIGAKDGFILTNNHVVDDAIKIEVQFLGDEDDDTYAAKVIGKDALTDSALIQLIDRPSHPLMEAKFGDSAQMAAGDWVMAIGNPFGYAHTVTVGIISAMARPFYAVAGRSNEMIQTDAAINPGNSGGPLLNIRGEVIGINTAIISSERGGNVGNIGIGFAVPINAVRELLPQLHQGKVVRGRIGVQVIPVPRDGFEDYGLKSRMGAVVQQVTGRRGFREGRRPAWRRDHRIQRPAGSKQRRARQDGHRDEAWHIRPYQDSQGEAGKDAPRDRRGAGSRRRTANTARWTQE